MTREELLQSAKPILFNTEMVRAILDGRKAVTRRVVKNLPEDAEFGGWLLDSTCQEDAKDIEKAGFKTLKRQTEKAGCIFVKPPCVERDILYVRETFAQVAKYTFWYRADNAWYTKGILWRPSIHMPKEAARIFLKVTDVRVERLQEMRSEDALNEGIKVSRFDLPHTGVVSQFKNIWNSTIKKSDLGKYDWDANLWVWVIEFERVEVDE